MQWVQVVILISLLQFFGFGIMVGRMRRKYGVAAPAMSGNPVVERYIRVQQNTLETLMMFLPSLVIATQYWSALITAGLGVVYIAGRFVYFHGYTEAASKRHVGYGLTMVPIFILMILAFVGIVRSFVVTM